MSSEKTDRKKPTPPRRAAKHKAPKARVLDGCQPEANLAEFLADLATNRKGIRDRFSATPDKVMAERNLSQDAKDAINGSLEADLLRLICVSQQNT